MSEFDMSPLFAETLPKRKKWYCPCIIAPIYIVLFFQLLNFALFCYIGSQIAPIKTQLEPLVNKSTEILNKINIVTFTFALNKVSVVVGKIDQSEFLNAVNKATGIINSANESQFNSALDKTGIFINEMNETQLAESVQNIQVSIIQFKSIIAHHRKQRNANFLSLGSSY